MTIIHYKINIGFCSYTIQNEQTIFFDFSAADLSNYHYPGRNRGYHLGGGPVSSPVSGGVTTGPHRPAVFRTGWE